MTGKWSKSRSSSFDKTPMLRGAGERKGVSSKMIFFENLFGYGKVMIWTRVWINGRGGEGATLLDVPFSSSWCKTHTLGKVFQAMLYLGGVRKYVPRNTELGQ